MKRHDGVCQRDLYQRQTKRRSWRCRPFVVRRHRLVVRLPFRLDRLVDLGWRRFDRLVDPVDRPVDLVGRLVDRLVDPVGHLVDRPVGLVGRHFDRLVDLVERRFGQRFCLD